MAKLYQQEKLHYSQLQQLTKKLRSCKMRPEFAQGLLPPLPPEFPLLGLWIGLADGSG